VTAFVANGSIGNCAICDYAIGRDFLGFTPWPALTTAPDFCSRTD
jgi:hypothetical protein